MRKTFVVFLIVWSFLLFVPKVSADKENFEISAETIYKVSENGSTNVSQKIRIRNKKEFIYAPSYSVSLGIQDIKNISVVDTDQTPIPFNVSKTEEGITIESLFTKRVVGQDAENEFIIYFDTGSIVRKNGNIWETDIPGLSNADDFSSFTILLQVPESFGKATIIKPFKNLGKNASGFLFNKDDVGKTGIYIIFGDSQFFDFSLSYHLTNSNLFPVKTEIALPPNTNYQQVIINDINPKPSNTYIDSDGNWLATYLLSSKQKLDIKITGVAKINAQPVEEELPDERKKLYLKNDKYWETDDEEIKRLAKTLKTPQAIYNFVVNKLNYNYEKVISGNERLGAKKSLQSPNFSVCLEFTDLFIAIARAAGIPTRSIEGFGYTQNEKLRPLSLVKDILHSWPQYYDDEKKTWIMIDPTWGNTTAGLDYFKSFDLSHFAFVIKGADSTYPIPAGGYKDDPDTKDITINFAKSDNFTLQKNLDITNNFPNSFLSGFQLGGSITVANNGNGLVENEEIKILSDFSSKLQTFNTGPIPPFGNKQIKVTFNKTPLLTNKMFDIRIYSSSKEDLKRIKISLLPGKAVFWIGGGGVFVIISAFFIISALKARRLPFQGLEKQDNLHRQSKKP